MKTTTIITIIIFVHSVGLAQNVHKTTFQRPEVATLSAEVQAPVSLNSGALAIEIPLYTLKQGDITVPISISYDATGIRVGSHPGWTGQNWTLKAGGVITRVTKSIPDESRVAWDMYILNSVIRNEYFWGNAYNFGKLLEPDWNTTSKITEWAMPGDNFSELEPDEFIFNFCGHAGKFYLDANGPRVIGQNGYIIEPILLHNLPLYDGRRPIQENGRINDDAYTYQDGNDKQYVQLRDCRIFGFKIIDPQGFIYYFGEYEKVDNGTINYYDDNFTGIEATSNFFSQLYDENYSTWYLVKIVSPLGYQVEFEYENNPEYACATFSNNYSMTKMRVNDQASFWNLWSPGYMQISSEGQFLDGSLIITRYLKSIKTDDQTINFKKSKAQALDYDYSFIQSYLHEIARTSYNPNIVFYGLYRIADSRAILNNNRQTVQSKVFYPDLLGWAKLDEISINWNTGNTLPIKFLFSYRENLSERLQLTSIQKKSGTEMEPPYQFEYNNSKKLPSYLDLRTDHWGYYNGTLPSITNKANYINYRQPNSNYTDSEILKKITYPTGGKKEFIYEPNKYSKVVRRDRTTGNISIVSVPESTGGGLRIKEIIERSDTNTLDQRKIYSYSEGILNGEIQYYWPDYKGRLTNGNTYTSEKFFSSTMLPVSDNPAGGSVSYTKVTESIPGSGRIEYTFTNHDTHSDQNAVSIDPQKSAYSPFTSRAMERGKLIKEEVFKEQEAQPIRRITYTYYMPNQENFLRAVQVRNYTLFDGTSPNVIEGSAYKIYTDPVLLKTRKEEVITENTSIPFKTEVTYAYNDLYLVSQEDKKESNPLSTSLTSSKITYSYAHNTNRVLKDKNILTLVSSIKKYNNDDIILETGYQYMANLPVATRKCIYTQGPTTYHIIWSNNVFDIKGNPVFTFYEGTLGEVQIWGFNYKRLIARVQNIPNYNMIKEAINIDPREISPLMNPDMELINSLREKLPEALITTYTYDVRGNVTSITEPDGLKTTFEYDALDRLIAIKDHAGNLIESYDYHYKN